VLLLTGLLAACPHEDARQADAGARDAGVDAADEHIPDASADACVLHPECAPYFQDTPWVQVVGTTDRLDTEYGLTIAERTDSILRAEDDADPELFIELRFAPALGLESLLPDVGASVLVLGGMCDQELVAGYLRIMNPEREILWEGGSTVCTLGDRPWGPYLGERERPSDTPRVHSVYTNMARPRRSFSGDPEGPHWSRPIRRCRRGPRARPDPGSSTARLGRSEGASMKNLIRTEEFHGTSSG
jgi:hypothetical protein